MKKIYFLIVLVTLLSFSCSTEKNKSIVDLTVPWKFHPGDDPAWADPAFNDSSWVLLQPSRVWDEQGYEKLDGYGWYRIRFVLPSGLKNTGISKDSIQFLLGRIDDCDQVYLNGRLVGENTVTLYCDTAGGDDFIQMRGVWNKERRYVLGVQDPRLLWDRENVIAIRVYDQGGLGGLFSNPFSVAMIGLGDYVKFDPSGTRFVHKQNNILTHKFAIENRSARNDFSGILVWKVTSRLNGNILWHRDSAMTLHRNSRSEIGFSVKKDVTEPAVAELTFTEDATGESVKWKTELPYILTPASPEEPRINGAKVFGARPWSPFLFPVAATGKKPLKYKAENLPEGLKLDSLTGLITGTLKKKGEFVVSLTVTNARGRAEKDLKIVCGNLISLTPPMGWNSWNCWGLSVSDEKIRRSADAMKSSGLSEHGWTYINIDDGWENTHDKDGRILTNSKFPNMYALCDYVHSLGLKIGIYSSPGTKTCGGYEGSYSFEEKDAEAYAAWGIDYLKYDWCSYGRIAPDPTLDQMKHPYRVMRNAIRKVNRDIHYSLCQYGMGNVWEWGATVDGNSWRTTGDIEDTWESLSGIGFLQGECSPYSAPGHWNDPDMLVVGWVGWGPSLHCTRLTPSEQYTHISLWCLLSSPLLIGCDLEQMDPFTLNLLTNDEVLSVNQDPLGKQATQFHSNPSYEIWIKDLEDGSKAIGLFNKTEQTLYVPVKLKEMKLDGRWNLRDLWTQKDLGRVENYFEMKVLPHGARLVKVAK